MLRGYAPGVVQRRSLGKTPLKDLNLGSTGVMAERARASPAVSFIAWLDDFLGFVITKFEP